MAFIPKTWVDNQTVYAADMNRIEQGIANAVSVTSQTFSDAQKEQARGNINAAPGGFGFGTLPPVVSNPDSLVGTVDGIYHFYNLDNKIEGKASGILVHYQSNFISGSSFCRQIFYPGGKWAYHLERAYAGTWTEWEWVNPPMKDGVEYRTTERYLGKPVYVRMYVGGQLPDKGYTGIDSYASNVDQIVDFGGMSPHFGKSLLNPDFVTLSADTRMIKISCTTDLSAETQFNVWIKYTKTTD